MPVPNGVNPEKYDRCVDDVKGQKGAKNAYAICSASLQRSEVDWSQSDITKAIDDFNGMLGLKKASLHMAENPDKDADAQLGEDVEHLVEDHMRANAAAERKEGHKI